MECVEHVGVGITKSFCHPAEFGDIHAHHRCFTPDVILCGHVEAGNIRVTVVVDIVDIDTHGEVRDLPCPLFHLIGESPVLLIYVNKIGNAVIVGYIKVCPAIVVDIRSDHSQTESYAHQSSLLCDIGEFVISVIAV